MKNADHNVAGGAVARKISIPIADRNRPTHSTDRPRFVTSRRCLRRHGSRTVPHPSTLAAGHSVASIFVTVVRR